MQIYQILTTPLALAREYLGKVIEPGDWAVDATLGKGRDTLFLAEMVGEKGKVFGFDIQDQALEYTRQALQERNWLERVELIKANHADIDTYLPQGRVKAIMFNLGYLPGGDHSLITKPQTTVTALEKSLAILDKGGLITLVVYSGHVGGMEERMAVEEFLTKLDPCLYSVIKLEFLNRANNPPLLLVIEKR